MKRLLLLIILVAIVGCDKSTPVDPRDMAGKVIVPGPNLAGSWRIGEYVVVWTCNGYADLYVKVWGAHPSHVSDAKFVMQEIQGALLPAEYYGPSSGGYYWWRRTGVYMSAYDSYPPWDVVDFYFLCGIDCPNPCESVIGDTYSEPVDTDPPDCPTGPGSPPYCAPTKCPVPGIY